MDRRGFLLSVPAVVLSGRAMAESSKCASFLKAAHVQTLHAVTYDSGYTRIAYPMGDVAPDKGVCSDVVIRAYRTIGIDLQQQVHEDMMAHFALYPKNWALNHPDSNIDHRRVPNLSVFLTRFAQTRPITQNPKDYMAGDLVTYRLPGNHQHIAIVSDDYAFWDSKRPQIIHNIGRGPKQEDELFSAEITGHYRYAL